MSCDAACIDHNVQHGTQQKRRWRLRPEALLMVCVVTTNETSAVTSIQGAGPVFWPATKSDWLFRSHLHTLLTASLLWSPHVISVLLLHSAPIYCYFDACHYYLANTVVHLKEMKLNSASVDEVKAGLGNGRRGCLTSVFYCSITPQSPFVTVTDNNQLEEVIGPKREVIFVGAQCVRTELLIVFI